MNRKFSIYYRLLKYATVLLLFIVPLGLSGQNKPPNKKQSLKKRQKELRKKKEEQKKEEEDVAEYLREKHLENQSKKVRKRMKKSRRKAKRINKNRKQFFLIRWFKKWQR